MRVRVRVRVRVGVCVWVCVCGCVGVWVCGCVCMCVCTLLITCSLNIDLAGECGMIVGPHSTKLPQSWDTGSDQPSVPASEDSDRLS